MPIKRIFETRRISIIRGCAPFLVKVVRFHLRGHGNPQGNATTNFFLDSNGFLSGLSNEVSFISGFLTLFHARGGSDHLILTVNSVILIRNELLG